MQYPRRRSAWDRCAAGLLLLLCLCVFVQMLGVPPTLLDPAAASDAWGDSVLEGLSVPPSLIQIRPSDHVTALPESRQTFTRLVLIQVPFHPPVPSPSF